MNQVFVFLDTNIFLHCQPIEQINWPETTGSDLVTLVVASVVVRELDKHKDQHRISTIRDRARAALKKVSSVVLNDTAIDLPQGVNLITVGEPNIDFNINTLDRQISDDHLVAACLAFQIANPDALVILIAHDTGPLLKAAQRDIKTATLPEKYLLPSAIDDIEKELKQLRRQVVQLENQFPKLELSFTDKSTYYRATIPPPLNLTEEDILQRIAEHKAQYPELNHPTAADSQDKNPLAALSAFWVTPKPEEYTRYNEELKIFHQKYEKYFRSFAKNKNIQQMTVRLDIALFNNGTSPAEDIDVFLHLPDGFDVYDEDNCPIMPEEPTPPHPPRSMSDMLGRSSNLGLSPLYVPQKIHFPSVSNVSELSINKSNSYDVNFSVGKLKQYMSVPSDPLFIVFDSFSTASSFGIEYRINAANLHKEVTGTLHVVIDK